MNPATEVRALLARHGLRPKHGLGQHFLVDASVYARLVNELALAPEDWVIEIGAGLGTLTRLLCDAVPGGRVVALERDPALGAVLAEELGPRRNFELWLGDAVAFELRAAAARAGRRLVIAGNLPYQISSPILARLEDAAGDVRRAVVMLQREVAARLVAAPGSDDYGSLSVMVPLHYDVRLALKVGRRAFWPPPKVESALVRLEGRPMPRVAVADEACLRRVVRAAFGQRRKTLRNALGGLAPKAAIEAALEAAQVDGRRRGETLSLAEFARVAAALAEKAEAARPGDAHGA
jgi:16S rRNA (adenine1518-N6/adenine1519-N6)-dimethyltransferase